MALIDVIKYEGSNNVLVWKHPVEDFNTSAQLIVHDSQEAIVFKDGQASEPYLSGTHTIETANIPGIKRIVGLATGGVSPNHCEVFFINKSYSMNVCWGTPSPWEIHDISYQMPVRVQIYGSFNVKVIDSKTLIRKLVGTTTSFSQYDIHNYFRGIIINRITQCIANTIDKEKIAVVKVNSKLYEIAEKVLPLINKTLEKYGIEAEDFAIEGFNIIEDEYYKGVKKAQEERARNVMLGTSHQYEEAAKIAMEQAKNTGQSNQVAQAVTGVVSGFGMAKAIGSVTQRIIEPLASEITPRNYETMDQFSMGSVSKNKESTSNVVCPNCGAQLVDGSKYCNNCGAKLEKEKNEEEYIECPNCGEKNIKGSNFCNNCGTKLGDK